MLVERRPKWIDMPLFEIYLGIIVEVMG